MYMKPLGISYLVMDVKVSWIHLLFISPEWLLFKNHLEILHWYLPPAPPCCHRLMSSLSGEGGYVFIYNTYHEYYVETLTSNGWTLPNVKWKMFSGRHFYHFPLQPTVSPEKLLLGRPLGMTECTVFIYLQECLVYTTLGTECFFRSGASYC